jgi:hypothetical protein
MKEDMALGCRVRVFVGGQYNIGKGLETGVNIDISVLQALTCPLRWKGFHRGVGDSNGSISGASPPHSFFRGRGLPLRIRSTIYTFN